MAVRISEDFRILCGFLLYRIPQLTLAIHIHILARLAKITLSTANVT